MLELKLNMFANKLLVPPAKRFRAFFFKVTYSIKMRLEFVLGVDLLGHSLGEGNIDAVPLNFTLHSRT